MPAIPPLSALRAFEATARLSSVSAAAAELNVTDGAVSRAVRELEAALGLVLFERGNRTIRPTQSARELARDVRVTLDNLSAALQRARDQHSDRPVTLSCEPTFLIRWLIPRLASLQEALGQCEIRILSAGGPVQFAQAGVDLAIRRLDFPTDDSIRTESFLKERVGPVCRPDIAQRIGIDGPLEAVLLHTATRSSAWQEWQRLSMTEVHATGEIQFEHFYQSLAAAVAGAGVAIGPLPLVEDDIANGSLAAPRGFVDGGCDYGLLAPRSSGSPEVFDLALRWLTNAFANETAIGLQGGAVGASTQE